MSLVFCDSFDHYATADYASKYTSRSGAPAIASGGRNGTSKFGPGGNDQYFRKSGLPNHATYVIGFAVKPVSSVGGSANAAGFVSLNDAGTRQVFLAFFNGFIRVLRSDNTVLGTSTLTMSVGNFYYVELKVLCSPTVGTIEVRVNGVVWISATGLNTRASANSQFNEFDIGSVGNTNGASYDIDDLYVLTGAGSTNNDFLGDIRVECLLPNGDGNSSVLVGSDGNSTNNSLLVDETTPNGDTDYVESATPGDKDTYAYGNLVSTAGTVFGVQVGLYARKTDAGSRSVVSVNRLSGTEVDSAVETLLDTYTYLFDIRETKPGGGAYAISDVNSSEFGVKVNA